MAGYLLFVVAVVIAIESVITIVTVGSYSEAVRRAVAAQGVADAARIADQISGFLTVIAVVTMVVYLLLAAGFVTLGLLDLRGKNPARIVTWVLAGIGVLCFGCSALGSASGGLTGLGTPPNGVDTAEVTKQIQEAIPQWVRPVQTVLVVINLLALIAIIVLLALPASNEYFRPAAAAGYQAGYPVDPGYPSYPSYPGYPPAGQQQPPYGQEPPPPPPYGQEPPYSGPPSA
jgi:hypothetical protein